MPSPKLTSRVTITTPQDPTIDSPTGLVTTPEPHVANGVPARFSQIPVANVGGQVEFLAGQDTVISFWTILVGPNTVLTSRSTVVDEQGRKFQIVGQVADRPNHRPQFRAAAARLISDMQ